MIMGVLTRREFIKVCSPWMSNTGNVGSAGTRYRASGGIEHSGGDNARRLFLLSSRTELRQAVAVKLYLKDEVTLSRAAEIAGMNIWQFRDHLRARGINIVVPEETSEDLDAMIASFRKA